MRRAPAFSVVLYVNQSTDAEGTARMARLTSDLIDLTARHGGRFFLPYQLHYTPAQLERVLSRDPRLLRGEAALGPGRAIQQHLVCALRAAPGGGGLKAAGGDAALDHQPGAGAVERGGAGISEDRALADLDHPPARGGDDAHRAVGIADHRDLAAGRADEGHGDQDRQPAEQGEQRVTGRT